MLWNSNRLMKVVEISIIAKVRRISLRRKLFLIEFGLGILGGVGETVMGIEFIVAT